jgi:hypothetical protein
MPLVACGGMPKHADIRPEVSPSIVIVDGPPMGSIFIDNTPVATLVKGKANITVNPGMHQLRISDGTRTIYEKSVFMEGQTKKIISLKTN